MVTPDVHEIPGLSAAEIGWRAWRVSRGLLVGVERDDIWTPRRAMVAKCPYGCSPLDVPGDGCTCGIGAARGSVGLLHLGRPGDIVYAIGEVALWGKVVEGSRGWRAARAYPMRVYLHYAEPDLAPRIHEAYGVPTHLADFLQPIERTEQWK